ncbi:MAG: PilZ domain-containing protein [Bacteriovoracia bacterium]
MQENQEWFLPDPDGGEALGPFSQDAIAKKLREGELRVDSFIWGTHFPDQEWRRISDLKEFQVTMTRYPKSKLPKKKSSGSTGLRQKIKLTFEDTGEYGRENHYRRYPRVRLEAEVIIHNDQKICRAAAVDISEKGVYVRADRRFKFNKGDEIKIVVRNAPIIGTFSAASVVMRINPALSSGKGEDEETGVGVYFLRVNPQVRRRIAIYILQKLLKREFAGTEATAA